MARHGQNRLSVALKIDGRDEGDSGGHATRAESRLYTMGNSVN